MPDRKVEYLTLLNRFQMDNAYLKSGNKLCQKPRGLHIGLTKYDTGNRNSRLKRDLHCAVDHLAD